MRKSKEELGNDVVKINIRVKKGSSLLSAAFYVADFLNRQQIDYARIGNKLFIQKVDQETKDRIEYDFLKYKKEIEQPHIISIIIN